MASSRACARELANNMLGEIMKYNKTLITGLFLVFVLCVNCFAEPVEMNLENATKVVQFADVFFKTILTKPLSHKVKKIENTHIAGQIDEWHDLEYQGFKLSYYRVVPENRNLLSKLSIVSADYQLPCGLKIGVQKSRVIEVLGKPTEVTTASISYEFEDPYSETVTFHFDGGVIKEIIWKFEID